MQQKRSLLRCDVTCEKNWFCTKFNQRLDCDEIPKHFPKQALHQGKVIVIKTFCGDRNSSARRDLNLHFLLTGREMLYAVTPRALFDPTRHPHLVEPVRREPAWVIVHVWRSPAGWLHHSFLVQEEATTTKNYRAQFGKMHQKFHRTYPALINRT